MTSAGRQLLLETVGRITQRPEIWEQGDCTECVLAHSCGRKFVEANDFTSVPCAMLGVSLAEAMWLFSPLRTLSELQRFAITGEVPGGDNA